VCDWSRPDPDVKELLEQVAVQGRSLIEQFISRRRPGRGPARCPRRAASARRHRVDITHPMHRYFRWTKRIELTLGGATVHLARLGAHIAAHPPGSRA
jgi:hypothetical protein